MKPTVGIALTGSFCTLKKTFSLMEKLKEDYTLIPILSERVAQTDTRFFSAREVMEQAETICGTPPLVSICDVEPLGPKNKLDLLLVCPCTGNTLSKTALGITDSTVTMAIKSHRRNGGKVLLALSTNDALSGSAKSLGQILDKKGFFLVPLRQDDPKGKPSSLQCDFDAVPAAVAAALDGIQLQPMFLP